MAVTRIGPGERLGVIWEPHSTPGPITDASPSCPDMYPPAGGGTLFDECGRRQGRAGWTVPLPPRYDFCGTGLRGEFCFEISLFLLVTFRPQGRLVGSWN